MCEARNKMKKIVNFVKEILMLENGEKLPVGLCAFECSVEQPVKVSKPKQKRELRLSELMDR